MKRLTFGTYANVLWLCSTEGTDKLDLITSVVRSVDPKCHMTSNAVSNLMGCVTGLPNGKGKDSLGNVIGKAKNIDPGAVAEYFSKEIIVRHISPNMYKLAYCAIRNLILEDKKIFEDTVVDLVSGTTKKALREQSRFALSHFLAGVFLYTITVNNREGKDTLPFITEEYIQSFESESELMGFKPPNPSKTTVVDNTDAFAAYMNRAKGFYETVKTLLFMDTPMKFNDIYLPNDIALPRSMSVLEKLRTAERRLYRHSLDVMSDVTVDALTNVSNFLIIKGTGGLGKSMMMRHLLLNAIEDFNCQSLIPVFVPLKEYGEARKSLTDYVYSRIADFSDEISKEMFISALRDGSFLLLLDGIDEIHGEHSRQFERELNVFADKYPNNYFVMSSRPFQTFISFSRFSVLELCPFTKEQALDLVDKLPYEPHLPEIKRKFLDDLDSTLFETHTSFAEIPLLLTIMLMTFKHFAEVPSKRHMFYREAFLVLFRMHDASKGAYSRVFRSGLDIDAFSNLFAEICFRSYREEKYEFLHTEFSTYFYESVKSAKLDIGFTVDDFLHDLCNCLCIVYNEGGKYHFVHRSFQEYFAAVFLSKQSEDFLRRLGGFFENRAKRYGSYKMRDDATFSLLHDIAQDKVEAFIFVPYLEGLLEKCDNGEGYWTFLETLYPTIAYEIDTNYSHADPDSNSFIFRFIYGLTDIMYPRLPNKIFTYDTTKNRPKPVAAMS